MSISYNKAVCIKQDVAETVRKKPQRTRRLNIFHTLQIQVSRCVLQTQYCLQHDEKSTGCSKTCSC